MVRTFSVRKDELNPTINTVEVIVNGTNYVITREKDFYATDDEKEYKNLHDKWLKNPSGEIPVVPMAVYERLKVSGEI